MDIYIALSACGCNALGTLDLGPSYIFGTCDVNTGQCECAQDGIIGRTCDRCAPGTLSEYSDFFDQYVLNHCYVVFF